MTLETGITVDGYRNFDGETGYLPESIQKWAGLKSRNPIPELPNKYDFPGTEVTVNLANLNDQEFTFEQIADVIEYGL